MTAAGAGSGAESAEPAAEPAADPGAPPDLGGPQRPPASPPRQRLLGRVGSRLAESLREPEQILALLLVAAFVLRAIWLTIPGSLIFDEAYYVNASRVILGWDVAEGDHYSGDPAGLDPNDEHPPLGKLAMAATMAVFGDNGLGWRLPSVIAGVIALLALYGIVRAAGGTARLGILAVGLFAFDNMALVHGRIGTLDMMVLAPILLAAWAGLAGRWLLAGALVGLGLLVKITALYGLLSLLVLLAIGILAGWRSARRVRLADLRPGVELAAGVVLVAGIGLWALDARFSTYTNPVDHYRHMLEYGAALTKEGGPPTSCTTGNDSAPWQWLVNDCQMTYFRITQSIRAGDEVIAQRATIDFRGAMNPVLLGAIAFAVPYAVWQAIRARSRLATWSLAWMGASYLPFIPLAFIGHRVTYIYYFLAVIPALAVAIALLLARGGLPRLVVWAFIAVYLLAFAAYFPFREIP